MFSTRISLSERKPSINKMGDRKPSFNKERKSSLKKGNSTLIKVKSCSALDETTIEPNKSEIIRKAASSPNLSFIEKELLDDLEELPPSYSNDATFSVVHIASFPKIDMDIIEDTTTSYFFGELSENNSSIENSADNSPTSPDNSFENSEERTISIKEIEESLRNSTLGKFQEDLNKTKLYLNNLLHTSFKDTKTKINVLKAFRK